MPDIQFQQVVRKCLHNDEIRDGRAEGKLLYDHNVFIDGVPVGLFSSMRGSRRLQLLDLDHNSRLVCAKHGLTSRSFSADKIGDMKAVILQAIEEGAVFRTVEQIEAEKEARREEIRKAARRRARELHADEMYCLLDRGDIRDLGPEIADLFAKIAAHAIEIAEYNIRCERL